MIIKDLVYLFISIIFGIILSLLFYFIRKNASVQGKQYASKQALEQIANISIGHIAELNQQIIDLSNKQKNMEERLSFLETEVEKWKRLFNKAMEHVKKWDTWHKAGKGETPPILDEELQKYW